MNQFRLLISVALFAASAPAQGLRDNINPPERTVAVTNQTMTGTWLLELKRPGAPEGQPLIPLLVTYLADGAAVGVSSDGTQSGHAGVWTRVGDRKFLQTMYLFGFNELRVLTAITKVRINLRLSEDGLTAAGTTEVVVLDREGKVLNTIPGTTVAGIRLSAERPADFEAFQTRE